MTNLQTQHGDEKREENVIDTEILGNLQNEHL